MKSNSNSKLKLKLKFLSLGLIVFSILTACDAAKNTNQDQNLPDGQEQQALNNNWCGYDLMYYGEAIGSPRLKTLFKVNYDFTGTLRVATIAEGYNYINNLYSVRCTRNQTQTQTDTLDCNGELIKFKIQNTTLETDIIIKLFASTTTQTLNPCTKLELENFR